MPLAQTTWDDLKNLDWTKQRIYNKLNELRDKTMSNLGDLAVNETFAKRNEWYCYNEFKGSWLSEARTSSPVIDFGAPIWEHTTPTDKMLFEDIISQPWGTTIRTEATVTDKPVIGISSSVEVDGLFGIKSMSFSFGGSNFVAQPKVTNNLTQQSFLMSVPPGEHWRLYSKKETEIIEQEGFVLYGLTAGSQIATRGKPFKNESYWAYDANEYLGRPEKRMTFTAKRTKTKITLVLMRVGENGEETEICLPEPLILGDGEILSELASMKLSAENGDAVPTITRSDSVGGDE